MKFPLLRRFFAGFATGWIVLTARSYSTIVIINPKSSFPDAGHHTFDTGDMIFNATLSIIFMFFAWGFGLVLLLEPLHRWWNRAGAWVILPSLAGAAMIMFSEQLGWTSAMLDGDTATVSVHEMGLFTWAFCYLLLIFPLVNWPRKAGDK